MKIEKIHYGRHLTLMPQTGRGRSPCRPRLALPQPILHKKIYWLLKTIVTANMILGRHGDRPLHVYQISKLIRGYSPTTIRHNGTTCRGRSPCRPRLALPQPILRKKFIGLLKNNGEGKYNPGPARGPAPTRLSY
jgi:hypothetical protein